MDEAFATSFPLNHAMISQSQSQIHNSDTDGWATQRDSIMNDPLFEEQPQNGVAAVAPSTVTAAVSDHPSQEEEKTSPLNGIGMWTAWLRSFSTPLLAMQDLFDNAVDASFTLTNASVSGNTNVKPKIHIFLDDIGQGGIVMRNSCLNEIPPMRQVLTIYESHKTGAAVGENGIGIKHACANLSTLSIILTKTADHYSIGILMEDLQQKDGAVFPSFQCPIEEDLEHALKEKCRKQPRKWGKPLTQYGDNDLQMGIESLLKHFEDMRTGVWRQYDNVFTVLLTDLRHTSLTEHDEEVEDSLNEVDTIQGRSLRLLGDLRDQLPHLYIHIQTLEVVVQHQVIDLHYWEKRLVEVAQFEVAVNQMDPWIKDPSTLTAAEAPYEGKPPTIRFFVGFDPYRNEEKASALRWCLYSRASGRLITQNQDARSKFQLVTGSNDFKQGLTILLDDYNSTMPLNPTKQDFAFPHKTHGLIHEANIVEWSAAITHFYWNHHMEKLGGTKAVLNLSIKLCKPELEALFHTDFGPVAVPSLCRSNFTTYPGLQWKRWQGKIRTSKKERNSCSEIEGTDCRVRLAQPPPPKKKRKQSARKTVPVSHVPHAIVDPVPSNRRPRAGHGEESKHNDGDEVEFENDSEDWSTSGGPKSGGSKFNRHFPNQDSMRGYLNDRKRIKKLEQEAKENQETIQTHVDTIEALQREVEQSLEAKETFERKLEKLERKLVKKKAAFEKIYQDLDDARNQLEEKKRQLDQQALKSPTLNGLKSPPATPNGINSSTPSTPNDVDKLRRLLRNSKEQSRMFQETADQKQARIELMQQEYKALESENKLLQQQMRRLQEYQEEEI